MVSLIATQGTLFDLETVLDYGQSILNVAQELTKSLIEQRTISTKTIQAQMNRYFLGTAASGAWQWKDAYEAIEVAQILYLHHLGIKILSQQPQVVVQQLEELTALCPTHTRRSEQSVQLQQFSTPLPLAYLVAKAGFIQATDLVQGNSNVSDNFRDNEFAHIRHVNVSKLTEEELNQVKAQSEVLAEFIGNAEEKLQELLTIPFNLRLIADLLGMNISVESLTPIQTQIELLDRFWKVRVISEDAYGDAREALLRKAVEKMVATRTLRVDRSEVISNTAISGDASRFLTQILSSNILAEWTRSQNTKVERSILTFSHHVLFDYAVSRLFLGGLPQTTVERLEADLDLVIAIRPSLVFHLTGDHFLYEYPKLDGECFQQFLDWLSVQLGSDYAILQIDQAPAHTSSKLR
ncbi:hypothetical protein [Nostoc sp.]|uniref:hypothetical protein n=1 Tax=Nostoc sp. TaxID=1180 RepID=UPI002FF85573